MPSKPKTAPSTPKEKSDMLGREQLERVSRIFKAMSETTRLLILRELKDGPCSVGQLVEKLDTSQANVSKQLKTLFDADLLERKKSGNQVIYSIREVMVLEMCRLVCDKLNRDTTQSENILYEI